MYDSAKMLFIILAVDSFFEQHEQDKIILLGLQYNMSFMTVVNTHCLTWWVCFGKVLKMLLVLPTFIKESTVSECFLADCLFTHCWVPFQKNIHDTDAHTTEMDEVQNLTSTSNEVSKRRWEVNRLFWELYHAYHMSKLSLSDYGTIMLWDLIIFCTMTKLGHIYFHVQVSTAYRGIAFWITGGAFCRDSQSYHCMQI